MILRRLFLALVAVMLASVHAVGEVDFGKPVTWDCHSLIIGGRRVCGVMGEVHYSRIPADEWRREVHKMKEGGITMIACYVFWNHIEELENQFDWSGQRHLRAFLSVCKDEVNDKRVWNFNFELSDNQYYFSVSVMCHEMFHTLGAPDLYHYDDEVGFAPVGPWDLMGQNGATPQHPGVYMKHKYGSGDHRHRHMMPTATMQQQTSKSCSFSYFI